MVLSVFKKTVSPSGRTVIKFSSWPMADSSIGEPCAHSYWTDGQFPTFTGLSHLFIYSVPKLGKRGAFLWYILSSPQRTCHNASRYCAFVRLIWLPSSLNITDTRLWLNSDCCPTVILGSWRFNKTNSFVYQFPRWKCNGRSRDIRYSKKVMYQFYLILLYELYRCRWNFLPGSQILYHWWIGNIVCFITNSYLQFRISRLHGITFTSFWWEGETALPSKCQHYDTPYVVKCCPYPTILIN